MPAGAPSKLTPETIRKLEEVFAMDGSIPEACFFAEISKDTYYRWIKENPKLSDRFEALRNRPVLLARQTVMKRMGDSYGNAIDYLSRKRKDEFGNKAELEVKTNVEHSIKLEDQKAVEEFHRMLAENRKQRSLEKAAIEGELVEEGVAEDERLPGVRKEEIQQERRTNNAKPKSKKNTSKQASR